MTIITAIQPDPTAPLARFAPWLEESEPGTLELRVVPLFSEPVPRIADCGDAIILLGGSTNALSHDETPWMRPLHSLLADARSAGLPVLGICLGHQILADFLGGDVEVEAEGMAEEGAVEIALTDAGMAEPLFRGLDQTFLAAESHFDAVVRIPKGAELLASSAKCPVQSFRMGSFIGMQFHPEATPEIMENWAVEYGGEPGVVGGEMRRVDEAIVASGRSIARAFAGEVARRRAAS
nr:type 1 glutamine amidotransferase [Corynebacterium lactis]